MKHSINISLLKSQKDSCFLRCKNVFIREKILTLIFGRLHEVAIIVPGNTIDKISVTEDAGGDYSTEYRWVRSPKRPMLTLC